MDQLLHDIAAFASESNPDDLEQDVVDEIVRHVVNAFACAIAAIDEPPSKATRSLVAQSRVDDGASVIGLPHPTTVEFAAFANSGLVRNLDFNDVYSSHSGGHPSNMFPGILAAAEAAGLSGQRVVHGIHVACEVYAALSDSVSLRKSGWDAGAFLSPACAAGTSAMLGHDLVTTANAVSLALTAGPPLGVIRSGTLSHWKGSAEGHSVMNGVFFSRLAGSGMTGPATPFTGVSGFLQQVIKPITVDNLGKPVDGRLAIQRTSMKSVPSQWSSQGPVELFTELRNEVSVDDIESIHIAAFDFLYFAIGGGRGDRDDKWDPRTRETADHSLPYLIAVALVDGAVTLDSFAEARILDPALRPIMNRITIENAEKFATAYPATQPVEVVITMKDGSTIARECGFANGHYTKPFTDAQVDERYRELVARTIDSAAGEDLLGLLRGLPGLATVRPLGAALRQLR
jgi:2-methylcitrate dehydratase